MYIHFHLKWKKKGCRQRACLPSQTGLSFIRAVSYRAPVRIIIVHHLECWTIVWQLIQVWRIRPDVSEMKSSLPLQLFLEKKDSSALSLSSQCETPHAHWQLEQMFSHKAQMGKADKHQRSVEKERSGNAKNPHSEEPLQLPLLTPALSNHSASLTIAIAHGEKSAHFVRVDVDNSCHRSTDQLFKKAIKVSLSCRTNQLALGLAHQGSTCVRILLRKTEGSCGEAQHI